MDPTRWSNILRLDQEYGEGRAVLAGRPLEAYIEVAARCNLRCRMCPITVDPRYQPGGGLPALLSVETFERLEPIFPSLRRAYLQGLGEPLLHPRLVELTGRLAAAGVEVWTTTNGTLLDQEQADALARAGLTHVAVSIDGGDAETYERVRVLGRWRDVVRGIEVLCDARRRFGRPEVYLNVVAMASNLAQLPDLLELLAKAGGDGVFVEGLYPYAHPEIEAFVASERLDSLGGERVAELLGEARRRADALGLSFWTRLDEQALNAGKVSPSTPAGAAEPRAAAPAERLTMPWACSEPWATLNINAAGEVRPCCFNDTVLGSLAEQTIEEIWNGAGYSGLRADMAAGRVPGGCATCVRNGRVKASPYLGVRRGDAEAAAAPVCGFVLEAPATGEPVVGGLVLVGRSTRASGGPVALADLPEVFFDGNRVAALADYAALDGDGFAAVLPIEYVSEGAHLLSLRPPGGSAAPGGRGSEERWLQVGRLPDGASPAVERLALAVTLQSPEGPPRVLVGGRPHPLRRWLCGQHAGAWLCAAILDVGALAPASHLVELVFEHSPRYSTWLDRLAPAETAPALRGYGGEGAKMAFSRPARRTPA